MDSRIFISDLFKPGLDVGFVAYEGTDLTVATATINYIQHVIDNDGIVRGYDVGFNCKPTSVDINASHNPNDIRYEVFVKGVIVI